MNILQPKNGSSHRRCSVKKGVLRNFAEFTGKYLYLRPSTLLKKSPWHRSFPVNCAKFLRTPFLQKPPGNCFWKKISFTRRVTSTYLTTTFFTTARNIASHSNTPPKIGTKYHYKKYICEIYIGKYHQTRYLWTFWLKLDRYMQYRFPYKW